MGLFDSLTSTSALEGFALGGVGGALVGAVTGSDDSVDTSALQADATTAQTTANTNLTAYYNALGIDPTTGQTVKDVTALTDAQKAQVAADKASAMGSTNQFMASAGLSDSSMAASARSGVESAATIESDQLQQQNLQNALAQAAVYSNTALTAMGISSQDLQAIYGYEYAEKQAQTQALSGLMSTAAMAAMMSGTACWVAREVYGASNPKWWNFREWLLCESPRWFRSLYLSYGERFALFIKDKHRVKSIIRFWMDSRIKGEKHG